MADRPEKPWTEYSDTELSDEAQQGLRGQGALVEALRRHREELVNQQKSGNALSRRMFFLAFVGIALTLPRSSSPAFNWDAACRALRNEVTDTRARKNIPRYFHQRGRSLISGQCDVFTRPIRSASA